MSVFIFIPMFLYLQFDSWLLATETISASNRVDPYHHMVTRGGKKEYFFLNFQRER